MLCRSLSGVEIPLLTVTSRVTQDNFNIIVPEELDPDDPTVRVG
jgi:hypothetical protein